jgi:hypothetical protein
LKGLRKEEGKARPRSSSEVFSSVVVVVFSSVNVVRSHYIGEMTLNFELFDDDEREKVPVLPEYEAPAALRTPPSP